MPTENRSSNTEMVSDLLPCPFCGEKPQITKHHREDIYSFMHRCQVLGPISWGFREDQQAHIEKWNARVKTSPQHHAEPISWMVGTAFWWTKEEAERDAAATGLPIVTVGPLPDIPDEYCLMPKRLTAENGAKALLLGEFKLEVTQECPECRELDEPVEGCEVCDGEGEYGRRHTIPWDMIKFIYSTAVRGLMFQPSAALERKP
ncbi:Lar family restriction alleviation protein [Pseudomonas putida]